MIFHEIGSRNLNILILTFGAGLNTDMCPDVISIVLLYLFPSTTTSKQAEESLLLPFLLTPSKKLGNAKKEILSGRQFIA